MKGNVIVGQSGGPTSVINASLAGVFKTARDAGSKVYGMLNGIEGLLQRRYVDISEHVKNDGDVELLRRTPSAFLGSCRFKLPKLKDDPDTYKKLHEILVELDIAYFFYIGGNDSMDTIYQLSLHAAQIGSDIKFMGVPKTIDNDLQVTDHTPGFGSAAKYVATAVKELIRDNKVNDSKVVTIIEIMGRDAGWLTAAAALSQGPDCAGPDLIYLPELPFDVTKFIARVKEIQQTTKGVVVCVSEGIQDKDGNYICELAATNRSVDAFGHKQLTGTAAALAGVVAVEIGCKVRAIEFSSLQRCAAHLASMTDNQEAFDVGAAAVNAAYDGHTGEVIVIERLSDNPYRSGTGISDVAKIANLKKDVPREWINQAGDYVTQDFINYARPLIMGEVEPIFENGLPKHIPYIG